MESLNQWCGGGWVWRWWRTRNTWSWCPWMRPAAGWLGWGGGLGWVWWWWWHVLVLPARVTSPFCLSPHTPLPTPTPVYESPFTLWFYSSSLNSGLCFSLTHQSYKHKLVVVIPAMILPRVTRPPAYSSAPGWAPACRSIWAPAWPANLLILYWIAPTWALCKILGQVKHSSFYLVKNVTSVGL